MIIKTRPPVILLKLLRKRITCPNPKDGALAEEAMQAALRPGLPPGVFTQLVTLAMRIGASKDRTKLAVAQLPPHLSFRDCAELIRRLTFEGLDSETQRILPRAIESLSTNEQPKDVLCVVLSSTKSSVSTHITDDLLNRIIDKGIINEWNIPELCKLITISGQHRQAILPIAQLLIFKYLGSTYHEAELSTLGMVLRTLADIRDLGVMRLERIDDVLLRFPMIANKWFIEVVNKPDLIELASAAHGFASLAPSNLLEWRAPQVCNMVANIAFTSLSEKPSSRSLSILLWSMARLAALTISNPLSPEKSKQILSYLAEDGSATSGDIVIAVWSLAKTVGHFSDFVEPLTRLIQRLHATDVPKFAWALAVGFGCRDSLRIDGLPLVERCVQLVLTSLPDTVSTTVPGNSKLIDSVMLWDSASLAGVCEADMPPQPDLAELIGILKPSYSSTIQPRPTAGHVGPVTTGRLLDLLGILHTPYVPRYVKRGDLGFRQPTSKYITCEVELSVDGQEDTDAFVIDGGSKGLHNVYAKSFVSDVANNMDEDVSVYDPPHEPLTGLYVMNDRSSHAELSALNIVASKLSKNSNGWLHLHVSHFPCLSCIYGMLRFSQAFEGIQVRVSFEWWTPGDR